MQTSPRRPSAGKRKSTATSKDAIALLKADHRQVEEWFGQFLKSRSGEKKAKLARQICEALRVHTTIEEEIFYPAFLEHAGDEDLHHEAEIEHDSAKNLIARIESSDPKDDYFDASVKVLSEMIKHHVKEEEKTDGMFAKARKSGMDLVALGEQLQVRKDELMSTDGKPPARRVN
jgi:hemerythrin superfamily protein